VEGIFKFVLKRQIPLYLVKGWTVSASLNETHHGHWSVIMKAPEDFDYDDPTQPCHPCYNSKR
jgi:hypothetical protein